MKKTRLLCSLLACITMLGSCIREKPGTYRIGFSQCVSNDAWRRAMHEEMKRQIALLPDVSLEIKDAGGNSQTQIGQINEFLETGIDLLIVSPNEAEPLTPVIEKAYHAGIPVICIDRKIASEQYTAYIGANNYEIGKAAGNYVRNATEYGDKVIVLHGLRRSTPAIERNKGFLFAMDTAFREIVTLYTDWTTASGKAALAAVIDKHRDVKLIFAHNDRMALGAFEVCKERGLRDSVCFVGIDGLSGSGGGIQLVSDGILKATFLYPTGGDEAIRLARTILLGKSFKRTNTLQTTQVDSSNVTIIQQQTNKIDSQQRDIERQQDKIDSQLKVFRSQQVILYALVILLVVCIILAAYALYSLKEKQQINKDLARANEDLLVQKEQTELMAGKAEEATRAKIRFYTNMSHEFRTPLTLVLGPLNELVEHSVVLRNRKVRDHLLLMRKNVHRLLRMVDQLMDFRKVENNRMKVLASRNDLVFFIREIKRAFDLLALKQEIDFRLITGETELEAWFDPGMMDKIMFNLLSNAFKFVHRKGSVQIVIKKDELRQAVLIQVKDTGVGIREEEALRVFDRFYQGEHKAPGTGIGLTLTRELVALHKGTIELSSKPNAGTIFTVSLPLGSAHFSPEELAGQTILQPVFDPNCSQSAFSEGFDYPAEATGREDKVTGKEYALLIIEDQTELARFIADKFAGDHKVMQAENGEDGWALAVKEVPDLIICDIMLPDRNGIQLTRLLKSDLRTSHIPIILLTARSQDEQKLEGIRSGADLYMVKPFNMSLLQESVANLLKNREMLAVRFRDSLHEPDPVPPGEKEPEAGFARLFQQVVNDHITEPGFGVNEVCEKMNLSRVQLYRKVKALFGYTVQDYLNEVRQKAAVRLLKETELSISEIAYRAGYSSPAYFSTSFKNHYKISPSDYRSSMRGMLKK